HLEPVVEAEQRLGAVAVVDETVERREEPRPVRHRPVVGVRVCDPLTLLKPDAECTKTLLSEEAFGLAQRNEVRLRPPTIGEIPQALAAATANACDLPAPMQRLEHQPDLPVPPPAVPAPAGPAAVLQLPAEQRPAALELAEDVPAEAGVLRDELLLPALLLVPRRASLVPDQRPDQR